MTLDEANITIDYLKEMQGGYIEGEGYERHPLPKWYALDKAIETIEQTTWIPVIEKLPEDEQEVLITYKINVKHHVWSAIWDKLHGRFYDKEYRSYISLNYVTAWMPLPEPYQPQEISDRNLKMWHDIYEEEKRRTEGSNE